MSDWCNSPRTKPGTAGFACARHSAGSCKATGRRPIPAGLAASGVASDLPVQTEPRFQLLFAPRWSARLRPGNGRTWPSWRRQSASNVDRQMPSSTCLTRLTRRQLRRNRQDASRTPVTVARVLLLLAVVEMHCKRAGHVSIDLHNCSASMELVLYTCRAKRVGAEYPCEVGRDAMGLIIVCVCVCVCVCVWGGGGVA
jgi:hypothetical protein